MSVKIEMITVGGIIVYFVDRDTIEAKLVFMEQQLTLLKSSNQWESLLEKAALERLAHTIIDAILDTGNAMIDGFIMRDPGSYEDIIDILTDEKVVDDELSHSLKAIISMRKMLVQHYEEVNHREVLSTFTENIEQLETFPNRVRDYLIHELGPVSAFRK